MIVFLRELAFRGPKANQATCCDQRMLLFCTLLVVMPAKALATQTHKQLATIIWIQGTIRIGRVICCRIFEIMEEMIKELKAKEAVLIAEIDQLEAAGDFIAMTSLANRLEGLQMAIAIAESYVK